MKKSQTELFHTDYFGFYFIFLLLVVCLIGPLLGCSTVEACHPPYFALLRRPSKEFSDFKDKEAKK